MPAVVGPRLGGRCAGGSSGGRLKSKRGKIQNVPLISGHL